MKVLIVQFIDCEGSGIIHEILTGLGASITYLNAYEAGIRPFPNSHFLFDVLIYMGGPQTVYEPSEAAFFKPYFTLLENFLKHGGMQGYIGICLGAQILAHVLGARVYQGEKGPETGFSEVKIVNRSSCAFQGIDNDKIMAYHLHGDVFEIPKEGERLLSGELYENQMFGWKDKAFGIQCHLEPTMDMLKIWKNVHKNFIAKSGWKGDLCDPKLHKTMTDSGRKIFENLISSFSARSAI